MGCWDQAPAKGEPRARHTAKPRADGCSRARKGLIYTPAISTPLRSSRAEVPVAPVLGPSRCEILPKRERNVRWKAYQGWYCLHANAQLYVLLTRGVTDGCSSVQAAESHAHSGWSQSIPPPWGKRQAGFGSAAASKPEEGSAQANVGCCHVKPGKRDAEPGKWDAEPRRQPAERRTAGLRVLASPVRLGRGRQRGLLGRGGHFWGDGRDAAPLLCGGVGEGAA